MFQPIVYDKGVVIYVMKYNGYLRTWMKVFRKKKNCARLQDYIVMHQKIAPS